MPALSSPPAQTSWHELLSRIRAAPFGLSLAELLAPGGAPARRSMQRRLQQWVAMGLIDAWGDARARRYGPPSPSSWSVAEPSAEFPAFIPLSVDSHDVLRYIDQPLAARRPVGYQRDFLQAYEPGVSAYLPEPLRRQLHRLGRTSDSPAPAGTYSRAILNRLLIDLSWASSHLEGNTYSRLDTLELIRNGKAAQGKAVLETQMILNHKAAIELLVANIDSADFNRYTLLNLHSALAENLLPDAADEGRLRRHAVDIGQSVYRPLSAVQQVDELMDLMLAKAGQIEDPFEQSFFMMVHLPYLQPFADINKRTSRLAANLPLFRANLCPLTFLGVPEQAYSRAILGVYEMTRVELLRDLYVWAYERSCHEYQVIRRELAAPDPQRLAWRDLIRQSVRDVVLHPTADPLTLIRQTLADAVPATEREAVQALVIEELRRLHEGVLARYGLRPSEFAAWQAPQRR